MRRMYWLTSVIVLVLLLRIGWIFYSRRSAEREARQHLLQQQAEEDRATINAYGGNRLTILNFYSTPPLIHRGQTAQLCYGVSNAKSVRIEPPVENVWPSLSRCVDVTPKHDTIYKLVAEDANGHAETATVNINVR
jgi:hypothetical protein